MNSKKIQFAAVFLLTEIIPAGRCMDVSYKQTDATQAQSRMEAIRRNTPFPAEDHQELDSVHSAARELLAEIEENVIPDNFERENFREAAQKFDAFIAKAVNDYGDAFAKEFRDFVQECLNFSQTFRSGDTAIDNLYVFGMRLLEAFLPHAGESFDPLIASAQFLEDFIKFGSENPPEQERFLKSVSFIPSAISEAALSLNNISDARNLIFALLTKDDSVTDRLFGPFGISAETDLYTLTIKMIAQGAGSGIRDFFLAAKKKTDEIPFAHKEMSLLINSILETLATLENKDCLIEYLDMANKLLALTVIPPRGIELNPSAEDKAFQNLLQLVEAPDTSDEEISDFFAICEFPKNLWEIPVYAYEPFGRFLLRFHKSPAVIEKQGDFFDWFGHSVFDIKTGFIKPIAYKLIYLHRAFTIGMSDVIPITREMVLAADGNPEVLINLLLESFCYKKKHEQSMEDGYV